MDCKKCGSPIKEGNSFCTNCGKEVNSKEKIATKLNIEPRYIIILIVVIAVIAIIVAVGMVMFTRTQSASINSINEIENVREQVQENTKSKIDVGMQYNSTTYGIVGYIEFIDEKEFFMATGTENSEVIDQSGNYTIEGDTIKLTVTYDSSLDYTLYDPEATFTMEPYDIEMTILGNGVIQYITDANYTVIFDKKISIKLSEEIYGTRLIGIMKNAIASNRKNEEHSIEIQVYMQDNNQIYDMETLYNAGTENFLRYYGEIKFKCSKLEYYENTEDIKYILFEQI